MSAASGDKKEVQPIAAALLSEEEKQSVARDIELATQAFMKHGQAVNPPASVERLKRHQELEQKETAEAKGPKPPGSELKARVDALEQSKYNPPLHSEIKTMDDGRNSI